MTCPAFPCLRETHTSTGFVQKNAPLPALLELCLRLHPSPSPFSPWTELHKFLYPRPIFFPPPPPLNFLPPPPPRSLIFSSHSDIIVSVFLNVPTPPHLSWTETHCFPQYPSARSIFLPAGGGAAPHTPSSSPWPPPPSNPAACFSTRCSSQEAVCALRRG